MPTRKIGILIVDDHALMRTLLAERLQREVGLSVVGCAGTPGEAIGAVSQCEPDLIVMDTQAPGIACFDAAQTIRTLRPEVQIVYLSGTVSDLIVERALQVGARGHVTKSDSPETLIAAIRAVAAGDVYFSKEVQSRMVSSGRGPQCELTARVTTLTSREHQILEYLARGFSKKRVAATLSIGVKTVERHASNIMKKVDVHDRVELALFAIREGLVSPGAPTESAISRGDGQVGAHRERRRTDLAGRKPGSKAALAAQVAGRA